MFLSIVLSITVLSYTAESFATDTIVRVHSETQVAEMKDGSDSAWIPLSYALPSDVNSASEGPWNLEPLLHKTGGYSYGSVGEYEDYRCTAHERMVKGYCVEGHTTYYEVPTVRGSVFIYPSQPFVRPRVVIRRPYVAYDERPYRVYRYRSTQDW